MAILYFQQLENKKIISNYHTDVGRRLKRSNDVLFNSLLNILKEVIDSANINQNNLYKYVKENYYFYIYSGSSIVLAFIADGSLDEKKLNIVINQIENGKTTDIQKLLNDFNNDNLMDDITSELAQTKQIVSNSLNLILNRGERIDQMNLLSDELGQKVKNFRKESEKLLGGKIADLFIAIGIVLFIFFLYFYFIK